MVRQILLVEDEQSPKFVGTIDRQQFIIAVQRYIPSYELDELLHFDIIPSQLLDEANMLPSLQASSTNLQSAHQSGNPDTISDEQLKLIAQQATKRNWPKLALTLGFLEYDIEAYKSKNQNDSTATVIHSILINTIER